MSPLIYAAREGRELVVAELLECGANVNKQDSRGWSVSRRFVYSSYLCIIILIIIDLLFCEKVYFFLSSFRLCCTHSLGVKAILLREDKYHIARWWNVFL